MCNGIDQMDVEWEEVKYLFPPKIQIGLKGFKQTFETEELAIDFFGAIEYNAIKNGTHSEYWFKEVYN